MKSYKVEVATMYEGRETWASNSCRSATAEEADTAGKELLERWLAPHAYRVVEVDGEPNYRFNREAWRSEPLPDETIPSI